MKLIGAIKGDSETQREEYAEMILEAGLELLVSSDRTDLWGMYRKMGLLQAKSRQENSALN